MKSSLRAAGILGVSAFLFVAPSFASTPEPTAARIPAGSIIDRVDFEGVLVFERGIILDRIGVKPGDVLTSERVEAIASRMRTLRTPHGFAYKPADRPGRVVLSIGGAGC